MFTGKTEGELKQKCLVETKHVSDCLFVKSKMTSKHITSHHSFHYEHIYIPLNVV